MLRIFSNINNIKKPRTHSVIVQDSNLIGDVDLVFEMPKCVGHNVLVDAGCRDDGDVVRI